jgi:glutamine amidotransferase/cyclase
MSNCGLLYRQGQASTSGRGDFFRTTTPQPFCKGRRRRTARAMTVLAEAQKEVTLLDYGAGNVRSVRNAIRKLGYTLKEVWDLPPASLQLCWKPPTFQVTAQWGQ